MDHVPDGMDQVPGGMQGAGNRSARRLPPDGRARSSVATAPAPSIVARVPRWLWCSPLVAALVATGVVFGALFRLVVFPDTTAPDDAGRADAVVMFLGGRGERLRQALQLMDAGAAPTLVIPNGAVVHWRAANELCAGSRAFEVVCPEPASDDTRGEARIIASLAAERHWDSVIMVTSNYHIARARLMLERCLPGHVTAVAASPRSSVPTWLGQVAHESLGHIEARVLRRDC